MKFEVDSSLLWLYPLYVTNVSHFSPPILQMQIFFFSNWNNKTTVLENEGPSKLSNLFYAVLLHKCWISAGILSND